MYKYKYTVILFCIASYWKNDFKFSWFFMAFYPLLYSVPFIIVSFAYPSYYGMDTTLYLVLSNNKYT
jgi:hypothetical protein